MIGTIINVVAILVGGTLGMVFGARLPERIRNTVIAGMGLFTLTIGIPMSLESKQPLIVLGSLIIGGVIGELVGIEDRLRSFGAWLEWRFAGGPEPGQRSGVPTEKGSEDLAAAQSNYPSEYQGAPALIHQEKHGSRFIRGFLTASLLYAIGPIAILGAIQDGLTGDFQLLTIKSILDGFASLAFASTLGVGVLFSSIVILVYQGGISLLAQQAQAFVSPDMMTEMTASGGVLLIGVAISNILEIKPIRVGNLLPALIIAPLIVAILVAIGISYQ